MKNIINCPYKEEAVAKEQNMETCVDWHVIIELHLRMDHPEKCIFVIWQMENGDRHRLKINVRENLEINDKLIAGQLITHII